MLSPFEQRHAAKGISTFPLPPRQHSPSRELRLTLNAHPRHQQTQQCRDASERDAQRERDLDAIHVRRYDAFELRAVVHGAQGRGAHEDGLVRIDLRHVAHEGFDELIAEGRLAGRDHQGTTDGLGN